MAAWSYSLFGVLVSYEQQAHSGDDSSSASALLLL
jgi:hypothetical protein